MGRRLVVTRQYRALCAIAGRYGESDIEMWVDVPKEETTFGLLMRLAHFDCPDCAAARERDFEELRKNV